MKKLNETFEELLKKYDVWVRAEEEDRLSFKNNLIQAVRDYNKAVVGEDNIIPVGQGNLQTYYGTIRNNEKAEIRQRQDELL